jgi:hypothetical protein
MLLIDPYRVRGVGTEEIVEFYHLVYQSFRGSNSGGCAQDRAERSECKEAFEWV